MAIGAIIFVLNAPFDDVLLVKDFFFGLATEYAQSQRG